MLHQVLLVAVVVTASVVRAITHGSIVSSGRHTYLAGLRTTATGPAFCSGALISPRAVLTTATCQADAEYVSLGSIYLLGNIDGERIAITSKHVHPQFNHSGNHEYDFAILTLSTATRISPVNITWDQNLAGASVAYVRGFGAAAVGGPSSPVLQEALVPIWSSDDCTNALHGLHAVTDSMFCAGGAASDACDGDFGDPVTVARGGDEYLVGLSSWGYGCGTPGLPAAYARVATALDFAEPFLK
ncbi:Aste57867_2114 [Aphanomyces stellatus]|uniref:Aste57867_2114 protein n=1 Tax=Aphanomyces stellatus TaxID=120398 RepID=A0A485K6Q6_9STRA|nr:hypothetical protein As57867_002109 [Aphanomyces stellatus]VFT79317.1 Aste57867_2114 [Aphanomyces stellatus]